MQAIALALLGVQTTVAGALVYQTARSGDGDIGLGIALMVVGFILGLAAVGTAPGRGPRE